LYTHVIIREDAFDIYGFSDMSEKRSFELLLSVSGVGPKAAQSILSSNSPESFAMAVISENEKALTAAPGIGKRIAQRIILELKDKIAKENTTLAASPDIGFIPKETGAGKAAADAMAALNVLGYSQQEISSALKGANIESMTTEEIIKFVLKSSVK
ncbi:MAG: Holliday junction branch migration protein RuvA, partial [Oscillospiraceae bacterium]|nr:Holliday junction branch migration protein RuvA [Oscillospiraceae bacterium]